MLRTLRHNLPPAVLTAFAVVLSVGASTTLAEEYADYYVSGDGNANGGASQPCYDCKGVKPHCQHCRAGQPPCLQCQSAQPHRADLFYNFYLPGTVCGVPAAMYPAPYPTPPIVGHVYYTYQPFMPHEFLYTHHRNYVHRDGFMHLQNRTSVKWTTGHYRRTNF